MELWSRQRSGTPGMTQGSRQQVIDCVGELLEG